MPEKVEIDPSTLANLISATEAEMSTLEEVLEEEADRDDVLRGIEGRLNSLDASVTIAKDELETQTDMDLDEI